MSTDNGSDNEAISEYEKSNVLLTTLKEKGIQLAIDYEAFTITLMNAYVQSSLTQHMTREQVLDSAIRIIDFLYTEYENDEMSDIAANKHLVN